MFRTYAFTEMPYPYIPGEEVMRSNRTNIPNAWYDPDTGQQLYKKYIDILCAADELGLDIMFNEHHSTMSCTDSVMPLMMSTIAHQTHRARLLALGNPVANRPDPVRVAEEMAFIDVLSGGRLECGFVRGVPMEMSATNASPVDMKPRFYEAIDLIMKAWTTHDGPFSWEGDFFHHRNVNIIPRPYQTPHPPVWITTLTPGSVAEIADRGYGLATILNGKKLCKAIFDGYRSRLAELQQPAPHLDRFAYLALVFVGESDAEARQEARKLQWFIQEQRRTLPQFIDVPGYIDPRARASVLKNAAHGGAAELSPGRLDFNSFAYGPIDPIVEGGFSFFGSPDSVFEQMKDFFHSVGGFGNLLAMMHSSTMSYALTRKSMELFAKEVLPRFREEVYEPELRALGLDGTLSAVGGVPSSPVHRTALHGTAQVLP